MERHNITIYYLYRICVKSNLFSQNICLDERVHYIKRTSKLSGYYEIIDRLALQGVPAIEICQRIKRQGYTGSISILKEHIQWLKQQGHSWIKIAQK